MKRKEIIFGILLIISLVGAVYLVTQNQESRRGAYFSTGKLLLQPEDRINKKVGEDVSVNLFFDSPVGTKIDASHTVLCYGNQLDLPDDELSSRITITTATGFNSDPVLAKREYDGKKCINIVTTSAKDANLLKDGVAQIASIRFKAVSAGEGTIDIDKSRSKLTGDNPGNDDLAVEIGEVKGTSYLISEGDGGSSADGEGVMFKYKVTYGGVKAGSKCSDGWENKLIVLGNGTSQVYTNTPGKVGEKDGLAVYQGAIFIKNMPTTSKVAVFIKGKKSLQVKYGKDGQTSLYNQAGGEIAINDENAMHDFSGFPLLAGDVTGPTAGVQDGIINAVDFSYVKTKVLEHKNLADGTYEAADLDGNCSLNTRDTDIVRQSLNEKQGQLY